MAADHLSSKRPTLVLFMVWLLETHYSEDTRLCIYIYIYAHGSRYKHEEQVEVRWALCFHLHAKLSAQKTMDRGSTACREGEPRDRGVCAVCGEDMKHGPVV